MIDNPFRQVLPRYTNWVIAIYRYFNFSPNSITVFGLLIGIFSACLVSYGHLYAALCTWWLSRFFDGTDGIYARSIHRTTDFGAFLDIVCDMAAYSAMIIGFAVRFPEFMHSWLVILFCYVLCITSALSLGSLTQNASSQFLENRRLSLAAGIAEGGETGVAYSIFLIFPAAIGLSSRIWILTLIATILGRLVLGYKVLGQKARN